jgi:hypothetical protein
VVVAPVTGLVGPDVVDFDELPHPTHKAARPTNKARLKVCGKLLEFTGNYSVDGLKTKLRPRLRLCEG